MPGHSHHHLISWRFFNRHRWQFFLSILSIALGTAVVVAVDLANSSASKAFALSLDQLTGRASHQIVAANSFDESIYTRLRIQQQKRRIAPVVQGTVNLQGQGFVLFGIDPFAEAMFRSATSAASRKTLPAFLTTAGGVIMSRSAAEVAALTIGSSAVISVGAEQREITLLGYFDGDDAGVDNLIVADIATVQELLNKQGQLDRIDLILDENEIAALQKTLPTGLALQPSEARRGALEQMTAAFQINLSALSLLAIVVGSFLVYNTMTFSVLQRRPVFAVQRMIGVTGSQLFREVLLEAFFLGLIGGLLGLMLGILLGQGLLQLVTRTINDLYFQLSVRQLDLHALLLLKGLLLALTATLLAAFGPALEAAKIPPVTVQRRADLEIQTKNWIPRLAFAGLILLVAGLMISRLSASGLIVGFFALFLIIIGYSLMIPFASQWLLKLLAQLTGSGKLLWALAVRGVLSGLSRTALAIAALAIAVSAMVGVGMMIGSFRASVDDWLGVTLQSDVFISAGGSISSRAAAELENDWLDIVNNTNGIASFSSGKNIKLDLQQVPIDTLVLDPGKHSQAGFHIIAGNADAAWEQFIAADAILISEPLAFHQKIQPGDRLRLLSTNSGWLDVPVAAVFRDYSSSQGMMVLPRNFYDRHWDDPGISTIGMVLKPNVQEEQIIAVLKALAAGREKPVLIRSSREIRQRSLEIFDRTFAITDVLRLLALGVAFVGVFSALMALLLERSREYSIYRATGVTPRQMQVIIFLQSVLLGFLAAVMAIPLGWLMSEILISVINQRAFGWSMSRSISPTIFIQAILLSIFAAVLAGFLPMRKIALQRIATGLRSE